MQRTFRLAFGDSHSIVIPTPSNENARVSVQVTGEEAPFKLDVQVRNKGEGWVRHPSLQTEIVSTSKTITINVGELRDELKITVTNLSSRVNDFVANIGITVQYVRHPILVNDEPYEIPRLTALDVMKFTEVMDEFPSPELGYQFIKNPGNPLNLAVHPKAQRYQYSIQIIPVGDKFIGIIGARDYDAPQGDGMRRIFYAESTDLITWTNGRILLEPSLAGNWYDSHVVDPYVLIYRNTRYLFFTGVDPAGNWQVGCAKLDANFNVVEVSSNPTVPQNFSGSGLDSPSTDTLEPIYDGGSIIFTYLGGSGNQYVFNGYCDGDPLDPANYTPGGELVLDQYPGPSYYVEGFRIIKVGSTFYALRGFQMDSPRDIAVYVSDDFMQWYFKGWALRASTRDWDRSIVPTKVLRWGNRFIMTYAGTIAPTYVDSSARETYRCGLAEVDITG